jgi:hypothetical protein
MRMLSRRIVWGHVVIVASLLAAARAARAQEAPAEGVTTADVQAEAAPGRLPWLKRVSQVMFQPGWGYTRGVTPTYDLPSSYYGLWERPDAYVYDARCEPRPWAPRSYGLPKHISCYRMDYAPHPTPDLESKHGPAWWLRIRRDPCCSKCGHHECDNGVAP